MNMAAKLIGGVRMSVPMMELMIQAVESMKVLCDEVAVVRGKGLNLEHEERAGEKFLTVRNMDVMQTYSNWECIQLILTHAPILNHLFYLIVTAFKKVQAHVNMVRTYC